ncbi:glycosyltransferase WbuB [Cupriavidus sp. YAF13]|uniref:glycosyltransferase WbuB n=1 Tax=Cupriavidus sp. YAF13 TaxID=3233075 RepID=UPI003F8EB1ED
MKILIYCLNYAPELTGIGKYTSEQAEWLVAQGHDVRVITAPPYYPEWRVQQGYKAWRYSREKHNGVVIHRVPIWVPRKPSGLKRLIHLASFAVSSFPILLSQANWHPDVVFVVEPPLFCSPATLLFGKLFRSKTWLHIQDFEVDAAFALGILRNTLLRNMISRGERWLLRRFDRVSTISHAMIRLAESKGVESARLVHFPNWVDVNAISTQANHEYRNELNIPHNAVIALYSGNMGRKQGLEILAETAQLLKDAKNIHFVFCGDGPGKVELENACSNLERIHFLPLQPKERLPSLLSSADIHLLPQRADAADLVMPSKLTGMLASGRPIVATAGEHTELAAVVKGRGVAVEPGNSSALAQAVLTLAGQDVLRADFGVAARKYAESFLALDSLLARFVSHIGVVLREEAPSKRASGA